MLSASPVPVNVAGDGVAPTVTSLVVAGDTLLVGEQLVTSPEALTVVFSEALTEAGVHGVTNVANWKLTDNGVDISDQITLITYGLNPDSQQYEATLNFAAPLISGEYVLTALPTITDVAGTPLDGDLNGIPGGSFVRPFEVNFPRAAGPVFQVNTTILDAQIAPSVATDADGNFVITWQSEHDGNFSGIFAQRYNAAGQALGGEFAVNTSTAGMQTFPDVALDANDNFVITWQSAAVNGVGVNGIFAQRFDSQGNKLGSEFQVNGYSSQGPNGSSGSIYDVGQAHPRVGMDVDGHFVVTWASYGQDGSDSGIYARRFEIDGTPLSSEFLVNTTTVSSQNLPNISMNASGEFVITWQGAGHNGQTSDVFAQPFNSAGVAQGSEILVNTTIGYQITPSVALDARGNFVIAWQDLSNDQGGYGGTILAQQFDSTGAPIGSEFQVNSATADLQRAPAVAIDPDGDYVIIWNNLLEVGGGSGVYGQRYSSTGVPQQSVFHVNTSRAIEQANPQIAMDSDGDFVVAWETDSDGSGNAGVGIFAQRFAAVNKAPVITVDDQVITYVKGQPSQAVMPQIVIDDQGTSLVGGTLTITVQVVGSKRKLVDHFDLPADSTIGSLSKSEIVKHRLSVQIDLGAQATAATVQQFLRNAVFSTAGRGIHKAIRTFSVTLANSHSQSATTSTRYFRVERN